MKSYIEFKCDWCQSIFKKEKRQSHTNQKHSFCSKECNSKFRSKSTEVPCTNCGKCIIKSRKGNNTFCSQTCAAIFANAKRVQNGYSTKGKTITSSCLTCNKEIIVSIHRPKTYCLECRKSRRALMPRTEFLNLSCQQCNTVFFSKNKNKKYCSKECLKIQQSQTAVSNIISGKTISSSRTKTIFLYKEKEIKCDSLLECACLKYFVNNFNVQKINRCNFSIPYIFENKSYNYIPDFIIELINSKIIVECKSTVGNSLSTKWHNYKEKSVIKQKLLENYAKENNMNYVWFSPENAIFRKIYCEVKKTIVG